MWVIVWVWFFKATNAQILYCYTTKKSDIVSKLFFIGVCTKSLVKYYWF